MLYVNDTLVLEAKYKNRSNFGNLLDWIFSKVYHKDDKRRIFYFTIFGVFFYSDKRMRRK